MNKSTILLLAILLSLPSMSWATVTIFDYNTTIADGDTYDQVVVKGNGTIVQMTGGTVNALVTMDAAVFNMTEGTVGSIYSHDNSQLTLSGGLINGDMGMELNGDSNVILSGTITIINPYLILSGNSILHIEESAQLTTVMTAGKSAVYVDGGIIERLEIGSFGIIREGTISELVASEDSIAIIVGTDISKRPYSPADITVGEVTGYWESGTFFSISLIWGTTYYHVTPQLPTDPLCTNSPLNDLDDDCIVSMSDFQMLATEWLECGLDPQTACP